jgi:hypothetical protein
VADTLAKLLSVTWLACRLALGTTCQMLAAAPLTVLADAAAVNDSAENDTVAAKADAAIPRNGLCMTFCTGHHPERIANSHAKRSTSCCQLFQRRLTE